MFFLVLFFPRLEASTSNSCCHSHLSEVLTMVVVYVDISIAVLLTGSRGMYLCQPDVTYNFQPGVNTQLSGIQRH